MGIAHWFARLFGGRRTPVEEDWAEDAGLKTPSEEAEAGGEDDSSPEGEQAPAEGLGLAGCPTSPQQVDQWFYPWLIERDAFVDQPLSHPETELLESFEQLARGQRSSALVPRLPMVIPQLMRSLKDERLSGAQLASQIAKDPALVGEVIRVANSPYYRRAHQITSLEQAVVLLGRDGLHQLIARVAFYPIFNLRGGRVIHSAAARVWSQSERCALLCHCLARRLKQDAFAAYLAGLTLNLGLIVGLRLMDQRFERAEAPLPIAAAFYQEWVQLARQLSHQIIASWNFPEGAIQAVGEYATAKTPASALGRCLALADCYSKLNLLFEKGRLSPETLDVTELLADPCYRRLSVEGVPDSDRDRGL